jgi:sugar phosphate isomerase/epimerase
MNRRQFLATATAPLAATLAQQPLFGDPPRAAMGIATTSFLTFGRPTNAMAFLEQCHSLGAGGAQMALPNDAAQLRALRAKAEQYGMYIEGISQFPKSNDMASFETTLKNAREAGALAVRIASTGGRRYEKWNTMNDWKAFVEETTAAVKKVPAIADRVKMPVGMENHKDFTVDEQLALLKQHSSEYFGGLLDFGNNISLLDAPEAVLALAPYARICHVKDMAVQPYKDGFLLSEVPLGEGILNLQKFVSTLRAANPKMRFSLEMITRDPLEVPCLTEKYWVTFPERSGQFLAHTLAMVDKESKHLQKLPTFGHLPKQAQLDVEVENVKLCLHYGRVKLGL